MKNKVRDAGFCLGTADKKIKLSLDLNGSFCNIAIRVQGITPSILTSQTDIKQPPFKMFSVHSDVLNTRKTQQSPACFSSMKCHIFIMKWEI